MEQTDWLPPPPKYQPDTLVPLRIGVANMSLRTQVKAIGGKWFPEELLWYVRYGAIAGGPLEKHMYIDENDKFKKQRKHLRVDEY